MSKHLKADNVRTLCGIDFSVLDYKVAGLVELPEDATCEWCVAKSLESNQSPPDSLDDILYGLAEECGVINKDISDAKARLRHHIQAECLKARIDEIKNWFWFYLDNNWVNSPAISTERIRDRIAELEATLTKDRSTAWTKRNVM